MKVAIAYADQPKWPKNAWVAGALRDEGHEVQIVRDIDALRRADETCEVVILSQKGSGLNATDVLAVASGHKAVWTTWTFDLMALWPGVPLAEQSPLMTLNSSEVWEPSGTLRVMRAIDVAFVKERSLLADYRALGVNAEYLDQGCPAAMPATSHCERSEWDVLVWGNASKEWRQRRDDVRALVNEGFVVAWAGHAAAPVVGGALPLPFCPPLELPGLAAKAAVVLCCDLRHDLKGYWSDRFWLALGMGACVLRRSTPGLPMGPYLHYHNERQLVDHVRYLRQNVEAREAMGREARIWVMAHHTIRHRCRELIERCRTIQRRSAASAAAEKS